MCCREEVEQGKHFWCKNLHQKCLVEETIEPVLMQCKYDLEKKQLHKWVRYAGKDALHLREKIYNTLFWL